MAGALVLPLSLIGGLALCVGWLMTWSLGRSRLAQARAETDRRAADVAEQALQTFKHSPEFAALLDLKYREGHQAGSAEGVERLQQSQGYEAVLAVEHAKGKAAGAAEERERWALCYTPVTVDDDGFFSHTVEIGYETQLFYNGMPVNDPVRRVIETVKKSKDENIRAALDLAHKATDLAIAAAAARQGGIPVKKGDARSGPRGDRKK